MNDHMCMRKTVQGTNILITKPVYHIHTLQVTENVYGKRLEENEVE